MSLISQSWRSGVESRRMGIRPLKAPKLYSHYAYAHHLVLFLVVVSTYLMSPLSLHEHLNNTTIKGYNVPFCYPQAIRTTDRSSQCETIIGRYCDVIQTSTCRVR